MKKRNLARPRTVTRTFRLSEELNEKLEQMAEKEGISINSLTSRILWFYQTRCVYCIRYGLIVMNPATIKALIENLSDERIAEVGAKIGSQIIREHLVRHGMDTDEKSIESIIVDVLGDRLRWFKATLSETDKKLFFYLHHTLGKKWSHFVASLLQHAMEELLFLNISTELTEHSVILTLPPMSSASMRAQKG